MTMPAALTTRNARTARTPRTERLDFPGHSGARLAARLDLPAGKPIATALFAHCFTCSKDIPAARRIAGRLTALGLAVLRFDFTGLGHSQGEFASTNFTSNVEDLVLAARHLAGMGLAPDLLIGHSLGGAAVLAAAADIPSARAVVTIGAPYEPAHVLHNLGASLEEIQIKCEAEVDLSGRKFTIRKQFLDDVAAQDQETRIRKLRKALLVLHAPRDATVSVKNAAAIFGAAKHPKSFVTLDGADHLLSRAEDAEYAAEVIAAWVRRYLALPEPTDRADVPAGVVRVSEADPAGFLQDIHSGPHHLLADEPETAGGTDLGPSPYDLLAAALGACTAMTIRMYARRKGLALAHVSVDVSHGKEHVTDCEGCEETPRMVDVFERRITLTGDLDAAARARLIEIAGRCPVHRTLEHASRVVTTEVPAGP